MDGVRTTSQRWLERFRDRLAELFVHHPAELAEFCVGLVALVVGAAVALSMPAAVGIAGGALFVVSLAVLGLPQMAAALHGSVRARAAANAASTYGAIAVLILSIRAEMIVAMAVYVALTLLCAGLWMRSMLDLREARAR